MVESKPKKPRQSFLISWETETVMALSTAVMAVATVVSVCVAFVQWRELRRSTDIAVRQVKISEQQVLASEDATKRQLRAYVTIFIDRTDHPLQNGMSTILRYRNVGQTPAYSIETQAYSTFALVPLKFGTAPGEINITNLPLAGTPTLGANLQSGLHADLIDPLSPGIVGAFKAGQYSYVTVAKITYQDIFGDKHFTDFCLVQDYQDSNVFGGPGEYDSWGNCDGFNDGN